MDEIPPVVKFVVAQGELGQKPKVMRKVDAKLFRKHVALNEAAVRRHNAALVKKAIQPLLPSQPKFRRLIFAAPLENFPEASEA